jgi:hypothetical protein
MYEPCDSRPGHTGREGYIPFDPEYAEPPESWTRDDFEDLLPQPASHEEFAR